MLNEFSRTEMLIGTENLEKLKQSKVAIFGIGGVGSFVAEGLARCGIGKFILIDNDMVSVTNINRQIHATTKTVGEYKVDLMKDRILSINPNAKIEIYKTFYTPGCEEIKFDKTISYIIDAVDTVSAKLELIEKSHKAGIPVISCMGTGNKLDPTKLEVSDIYKTEVCPLAKVVRHELKKRNIKKLKVVYSKEQPIKTKNNINKDIELKKQVPGSISFVPSVAGMIIAAEIVKDICKESN